MTRLAFVLPNMAGGGAERVTLTLVRRFLEQGHSVDLLLMKPEGELLGLVPNEVRVIDLRTPRIRNMLLPLWRYIRREKPDGIHIAMWPLTSVGILTHWISRSKARLVVSEHTILTHEYGYYGRVRRALMALSIRLLFPKADARVVVSGAAADAVSKLAGVPRAALEVIHNPIDIPKSIEATPEVEAVWGGAGSRILAVGSLKPAKNYPLLLKAFTRVEDPTAKLMIVGDGPLREELERLVQELGIKARVIMPGFFADPWPFYASADLLVLSSDYEGFGNVLVEAMAAGLNIVSTDCPEGPAEILDHGRFGRLVRCGDAEELACAIEQSLADRPQPERQRARALKLSNEGNIARYLELMSPER